MVSMLIEIQRSQPSSTTPCIKKLALYIKVINDSTKIIVFGEINQIFNDHLVSIRLGVIFGLWVGGALYYI
jgi:hypothetical protein